jgi:uncharacterized protein YcfJ
MRSVLKPVSVMLIALVSGCSGNNLAANQNEGMAVGGISGGLLGSAVGGGSGRLLTTGLGAMGIAGRAVGGSMTTGSDYQMNAESGDLSQQ